MKWTTAITDVRAGKELVRGYDLKDLVCKKSFVEAIYLVLKGELPDERTTTMLNAMFVSCIDHGVGVSSAMTSRLVVSTGNSLHTALASGILSFGTLHGSAIEDAAHFFSLHAETEDISALVRDLKSQGVRIPGYGHKILQNDPRTDALFDVARKTDFYGKFCELAIVVRESVNEISSKQLPLNVDGALAAIMLDMGFDPRLAKGFFIIGRVPGLVAHIYEEMTTGTGLRRLTEDEVEYTGVEERPIES
ncbi:citryl-CoA lyase [Candidatus Uhrbacteria bacterium]|nr:citryl-CoA lyase [Candidatus Uhrbacteria bacterium]